MSLSQIFYVYIFIVISSGGPMIEYNRSLVGSGHHLMLD